MNDAGYKRCLLWMRHLQQLGIEKVCNSDSSSITPALLDFHLMAKVKIEMHQFRDGLNVFGFLDMVKPIPKCGGHTFYVGVQI